MQRLLTISMIITLWFAQSLDADGDASFPNDLFFHHHPSKAFTGQGGDTNARVAQSNANNAMGNSYSPADNYGTGPYRAASYDASSNNQGSPWDTSNRESSYSNMQPGSYNDAGRMANSMPGQAYSSGNDEHMSLTYTRNGGIDWNEHSARFANANVNPYPGARSANANPYPPQGSGGQSSGGSSDNHQQGDHSNNRNNNDNRSDQHEHKDHDGSSNGGYTNGQGTFYDVETRVGVCGHQSKNTDEVAALNKGQMGDSKEHCGKKAEVTGPDGDKVTVTIIDGCSTCQKGGLDLSPAAFEKLGSFSHGSIPIKWKFVS